MNTPDQQQASSLWKSFQDLGSLADKQNQSAEKYSSDDAFRFERAETHGDDMALFYRAAFSDMGIGVRSEGDEWELELHFQGKGIVDCQRLFANLRMLSDDDIRKIRIFNRFVGQELFKISVEDILLNQVAEGGRLKNSFFDRFQASVREFAGLCGCPVPCAPITWPAVTMREGERRELLDNLRGWIVWYQKLPGIRCALEFFRHSGADERTRSLFNDFFHVQRQFDSDNWKDFDPAGNPYPQPLPRIAGYRKAVMDMNKAFSESEASITTCYDCCRLEPEKIINYIRASEKILMMMVNHLEEEYPPAADQSHGLMHDRARKIKHMLFPLRIVFHEQLEEQRGALESSESTMDSYFEMSLGGELVSIPQSYHHIFRMEELDEDLREALRGMLLAADKSLAMFKADGGDGISADKVVAHIQRAEASVNMRFSESFSMINNDCEDRFRNDESNLSRRLSRLLWLFTAAMSKKETMRGECRKKIENVGKLSTEYLARAEVLKNVDLEDEKAFAQISEDQLPLMASPDQMEDLFNTKAVVARLAVENSEFEKEAKKIEEGLDASLEMLRKSEDFLERLVRKILPTESDRKDLLEALHKLVNLSYKLHRSLMNSNRKAEMQRKRKKEGKAVPKESEKESAEIQQVKTELRDIEAKLQPLLSEKRRIIKKMLITNEEKELSLKQMRMIALMTINSMQAPGGVSAEGTGDDGENEEGEPLTKTSEES